MMNINISSKYDNMCNNDVNYTLKLLKNNELMHANACYQLPTILTLKIKFE